MCNGLTKMQQVDFYELWTDNDTVFVADVGIYGDEPSQSKADELAQKLGGVAHFDRTGIVYA